MILKTPPPSPLPPDPYELAKQRGPEQKPAFDLGVEQPSPNAFIQWKGTNVCMDFHCECGVHHHIDGYFIYAVKCHECGGIWQMPTHIYPRRLPAGAEASEIVFTTEPEED